MDVRKGIIMDIRHEIDLALVRLNAIEISGVGNVLALADAMRAIIQVKDTISAQQEGETKNGNNRD